LIEHKVENLTVLFTEIGFVFNYILKWPACSRPLRPRVTWRNLSPNTVAVKDKNPPEVWSRSGGTSAWFAFIAWFYMISMRDPSNVSYVIHLRHTVVS